MCCSMSGPLRRRNHDRTACLVLPSPPRLLLGRSPAARELLPILRLSAADALHRFFQPPSSTRKTHNTCESRVQMDGPVPCWFHPVRTIDRNKGQDKAQKAQLDGIGRWSHRGAGPPRRRAHTGFPACATRQGCEPKLAALSTTFNLPNRRTRRGCFAMALSARRWWLGRLQPEHLPGRW